jgi:hypothetical protein
MNGKSRGRRGPCRRRSARPSRPRRRSSPISSAARRRGRALARWCPFWTSKRRFATGSWNGVDQSRRVRTRWIEVTTGESGCRFESAVRCIRLPDRLGRDSELNATNLARALLHRQAQRRGRRGQTCAAAGNCCGRGEGTLAVFVALPLLEGPRTLATVAVAAARRQICGDRKAAAPDRVTMVDLVGETATVGADAVVAPQNVLAQRLGDLAL